MTQFIATLLLLLAPFFIFPPQSDVPPNCSLIRSSHANMAPPVEDCEGKKAGESCALFYSGETGICVDECKKDTSVRCEYQGKKLQRVRCHHKVGCNPTTDKNCPPAKNP